MDKKKVMELIEKGMLYQRKSSHVSSYKEKAKNCFKEALDELQKPDWISVEDELPEYGESVLVTTKSDPRRIVWITSRAKGRGWNIDRNGFLCAIAARITHWRKIDKLEV